MEGYGPNGPALHSLVLRGASLIVCVDCGTAAAEALGFIAGDADIVVLDHHKAEGPPPAIVATVNPNRLDCTSGLSLLCAAAVAFLAAVATVRTLRRQGFFNARKEPDLIGLLDLVALATVCDVMPLTGVNRALVCQGLKVMARRARPGVAALLDVAQARDRPTAGTCGFALGPRINAAGRIAEADLGLRLLLCEDPGGGGVARRHARCGEPAAPGGGGGDAGRCAARRRGAGGQGHATLVVSGPAWHPGVVGIVAGRIKERFNRPACVAGVADDLAKGSGRSVTGHRPWRSGDRRAPGWHPEDRRWSSDGGRLLACAFAPAGFPRVPDERLAAAALLPSAADLSVEGTLAVPGATTDLAHQLARLAPFGAGNEEPILVLQRARVLRADRVGREGTAIRAFVEGEGGGPRLKAMLFRARDGALAETLLSGSGLPLHLAGHLRAEEWNGAVSRRLRHRRRGGGLTLGGRSATHRCPRA